MSKLPRRSEEQAQADRLVREVLARVADAWTLEVLEALTGGAPVRFTRLRERLGGVSQKVLTQTLRRLERDGLVTRTVHATVPPQVEYQLTGLGDSLGEAVCGIWTWVEAHAPEVGQARRTFDERAEAAVAGVPHRQPVRTST
ncbi:MAG: helix-turn-helix domain-containing protein [Anaeromyxobacter sp.]